MNPSLATEQDTQLLRQAFDSFAEISTSLEKAYQGLQNKVRRLSLELEKSNDYLESVLQSLPCGVIVIDEQQLVRTINPQAAALLGAPAASNGSAPSAQARPVAPLSLQRLLAMLPARREVEELFEDGSPPAEIVLEIPCRRVLSCACSRMKRGERVLVIQDVTELRDLQAQMQKAERLAAMGEMAFEVAHEIRNPLTGLGLFANLLREDGLSQQERNRYLDNIEIGIRSLDTILTNMLSYKGRQQPRRRPVALHGLLQEILQFMAPVIGERKIRLDQNYTERSEVEADPELLRQAFMNLILNALQALPQGGALETATESDPEGVRVRIRDSGIGIPEELHDTVFEPHFTTTDKGNGLGLGIVRKIVQAHGGRISLRSGRGRGTEFSLLFPAAAPRGPAPVSTVAAAAGGRVQ